MWKLSRFALLILTVLFVVSGCGGKDATQFTGKNYSPTTKIIPTFQPEQAPVSCRIFSHLLVWLPADSNGQTIARVVEKEAMAKGADMLLVGGSRQAEDDNGLVFSYYGPKEEYKCRDNWHGWKFGYDVWSEQGDWVNLGYKEWGNEAVSFNFPIIMQAAFLRCQD